MVGQGHFRGFFFRVGALHEFKFQINLQLKMIILIDEIINFHGLLYKVCIELLLLFRT